MPTKDITIHANPQCSPNKPANLECIELSEEDLTERLRLAK